MGNIVELYRKNRPIYDEFTYEMQKAMVLLLKKEGIPTQSVMARVKEEASLAGKVNRKGYDDMGEITDICGLRIIAYFPDDVDRIGALLQQVLAVDAVHSVDKRKEMPATQFGYMALHVVAGLTAEQLQSPLYKRFENCKLEIQICSVLQHAWAEVEHDLEYKSQVEISYDIRRRFSRLAGLLEIADREFMLLRQELQSEATAPEERSVALVRRTPPAMSRKVNLLPYGWVYTAALGIVFVLFMAHLMAMGHFAGEVTASLAAEKQVLISLLSGHTV